MERYNTMSGKKTESSDNIVLYPGLVKRLIEKGMEALKEKDAKKALTMFEQAEQYDAEPSQILFGKALCYVELGKLDDAVLLTDQMLRNDIGNYYDILQIHLSLLVQLGRYDEVVEMLDVVLAEDRLPAKHAESFYQLLHFSRQMVEDSPTYIKEPLSEELDLKETYDDINERDSLEQWHFLQQMRKHNDPADIRTLLSFVESESNDPALRSYALHMLTMHKVEKRVRIRKFDQEAEVIPAELNADEQQRFGNAVVEQLEARLAVENPSLFKMAEQLWWQFLYALYPFTPKPEQKDLWAGAVHVAVHESNGLPFDEEEIAGMYNCRVQQMLEKGEEIHFVETETFQGISGHSFR
ncbi:tetratricopeptide repeat protein [Halalkalibacterium halodurans]|uniref:Uncharacterized protein n=1 Tax=Halalkalibacterium halodurans TaxID=86665 RepID=A0A0M0KHB2_ALKHA|nr:DUF3196 family protein [Halalkalibacterium halodurans]MED3647760.1 tetratricopeptide repeat protein [Halalkalibacterium halodurans]MED4162436.1 tetratricopeptide repeat protein [Halalkalibacterium halodurans]TES58121.1 DUF3196 domain-containing protein [Halalkalibacterium halodurans]TPE68281.1 DUF3196 domain-containing protein [Halalkalibacterium halodurans]